MPAAFLNLTESQLFQALADVLSGWLPASVVIQRGQLNRVAEPTVSDFVVMIPLRQTRLGTNFTYYQDNVLTGSITDAVLTVAEMNQQEGPLTPGTLLTDAAGDIAANTLLGAQISGTPGGVGTYAVSPSQTLTSEQIYAGLRLDVASTEWRVQLDVHGPSSGDNSRIIETLFRSEAASAAFAGTGIDISPLFCEEPRQLAFIDAEQQYDGGNPATGAPGERWIVEAALQANPAISTPQQFADQVKVGLVVLEPQG
jgi:hypothetical protein